MRLLLLLPALASALQHPLQSPSLDDDEAAATLSTLPLPSSALPWSDLNILSTTDTHGWVRGHHASRSPPESLYAADLGDLISFKAHLERIADERGVDILTVDSGDTLDGNGFVDADTSGVKGQAARELLASVHYDVATAGNHELYNRTVALDVYRNFIPRFKGRYLSSNVFFDNGAGEQPFGDLYATFVTKNRGYRITSFGVLFNFNRADAGFRVQAPSELVKQSWWQKVLRHEMGRTDVFLIVGHMATSDQDWKIVFNSIRELHPTTPILIFSGHAHVRDCVRPDAHSQILASGRYMETLGFTSLSLSPRSSNSISRRYLDTNLATYHFHSRTTQANFSTSAGRRTKRNLASYAAQFNLSHSFGVAPQSYYLNRYPPTHPKSLLRLYTHDVFPTLLNATRERRAPARVLFNTGAARFDIFKGNFTRDAQFAVIPFENGLWYIPAVPAADAQAVVEWLNNLPGEPELTSLDAGAAHHRVLVDSLEVARRRRAEATQFAASAPSTVTVGSKLSHGYVTQDACYPDAGGDDTPHRPLPAYDIPDFLLSQPSAASEDTATAGVGGYDGIDLVFYEFIAGLVIHALNAVQNDRTYARADVAVYSELKANELLGEYARMAWND